METRVEFLPIETPPHVPCLADDADTSNFDSVDDKAPNVRLKIHLSLFIYFLIRKCRERRGLDLRRSREIIFLSLDSRLRTLASCPTWDS